SRARNPPHEPQERQMNECATWSVRGRVKSSSVNRQLPEVVLTNVTDRVGTRVRFVVNKSMLTVRQLEQGVDPPLHHLTGLVAPDDRLFGEHLGAGERGVDPFGPTTADLDQRLCRKHCARVPPLDNSLGSVFRHLLSQRRQRQTEISMYGIADEVPVLATLVDERLSQFRDNAHLGVDTFRANAAGSETRRKSACALRQP